MDTSSTSSESSSVVVLDTAPEEDTATSPYFDDGSTAFSWPMAENTTSTLTAPRNLRSFGGYCVPEAYTPLYAGKMAACTEVSDAICVYADALRTGMRLPLHEFYAAVLLHYGLAPSQLSPNAWHYLAAFVLLCEDAGVEPMVSVFRHFFSVRAHKGDSLGWHNFRPISTGSRCCPLFTGKFPNSYQGWKCRFFFLRSPATAPWPCPTKWGKPRRAAVRTPDVTTATITALEKLLDAAGKNGIDVVAFLAGRALPVGRHSNLAAVKQEAHAEQSRKRKSPEPVTPLPLPQQRDDVTSTPLDPAASTATGGPARVSGGEHSATRELFRMAQMCMEELHGKEQDLQASKEEVARLKKEALAARDEHAADMARLVEELRQEKERHAADMERIMEELRQAKEKHAADTAQRSAEHSAELQAVKTHCQSDLISLQNQNLVSQKEKYVMGLKDMRQLALTMYPGVVLPLVLKHELLSDEMDSD